MRKTRRVTPEFLIELERKHQALALQEVEERKKAGLVVTLEWLDELERKHQALAQQEIAALDSKKWILF